MSDTAEPTEPDLRDAQGRTPQECWAAGEVFKFVGATLDGQPIVSGRVYVRHG